MTGINELLVKRAEIINEISKAPLWVTGSVVESTRKQGGKESPFYYLSQSVKGKNKTTYISSKHLSRFKEAASAGNRLKALFSKLSMINIKLIKVGYDND